MLAAGTRFDHFEVIAPLGAGGMGEVYLAQDMRLGRKVALKLLPAEFTRHADRLRRFEQEARAASALNHPNIITIYEIGATASEQGGAHFIAAEYIDGATLRELVQRERLPLNAALDYAIQIAAALAAAHEVGIIHRDLKPENVMVRRDGIVKVLDFGLAKLTEKTEHGAVDSEAATLAKVATDPGVVLGTPQYMAPEQARGQRADARADVFSLGVVLYEMLAGQPPFAGLNAIDVMAAILDREPPPLKQHAANVPDELQRIVTKALRKDREQRYQTSKDLLLDLRDCRDELAFAAKLKGAQAFVVPPSGGSIETPPEGGTTNAQPAKATTNEAAAVNTTSSASIILAELKRHKRGVLMTLAAAVVLAGIGFGFYQFKRTGEPANKPLRAATLTPFTSFAGEESAPAFSPDGNQIAFAWNGEQGNNYDIYVKLVDAGTPLRLTNNPAAEFIPAWSPDGRYVAFVRYAREGSGIFMIPALGGAERQLLSAATSGLGGGFASSLAWSPDGKQLVFAASETEQTPMGLFKLSLETLEKQRLTFARADSAGDYDAAFSPDGTLLAFLAARTNTSNIGEIYLVPAAGGEPRQLTSDNKFIGGLAWSADGREIIFSSDRVGTRSLWRIPLTGGQPERVAGGDNAVDLAVARQGQRLAFTQQVADTSIWRVELTNAMTRRGAPVKLIASTRLDDSQQYSPDGTLLVFGSNRSGHEELWLCNSDGSNQTQLTNFNGPPVGSPHWSPDGKQIAFDCSREGTRDIFVIGVNGGKPRRLTPEPSDEVRPSWSRDGKWIYYGSNHLGSWQVWKAPAEGGVAVQVTKQGGRGAIEAPDGKFVYYTKDNFQTSLWRIPVEGGEEVQVLDKVMQGYWDVLAQGIYFLSPQADAAAISFFSFATNRKTLLVKIDKRMHFNKPSFAVSADGRWLTWAQVDHSERDIMLMENFR